MADRSVARTRRRFARRQWARRWLTWRYLLAVVLLVSAAGLAVHALWFSSWLDVEGAEVVGEDRLSEADVLAAARVPEGDQLARVDLHAMELRVLGTLQAVESVEVSRQWPHELRIEVVEKEPVAVVDRTDELVYLDESGEPFSLVGRPLRQPPPGLPLVEIGPDADGSALAEAAAVAAALSEQVRALVDHVEVASVDQIQLHLTDGRLVRWGSAERSEDKAEVLLRLLDAEPDATAYDVSVPGMPTTR